MLALLVLLGVLLLPVVLTRSVVVKAVLLPRLESHLGARVTADRLVLEADARLIATGVEVRLPGMDGPAGELLTADRVEIVSSWGALLSGSAAIKELVLTKPRLRVSRDTESGSINLAELTVPSLEGGGGGGGAGGGGSGAAPPRVVVRDGVVELGEHTGGAYSLLRSLRVVGGRSRSAGEGAGYVVALWEGAGADRVGRGLGLTGLVTPEGITMTLDGLEFGQWQPEHIPAQFREVFELMRIQGGIPRASMRVGADGSASGVVELDGVSLNLPFDAEGRAADPANLVRLREVTGRVEVRDTGAEAFLEGTLGDLPSTVWLRYDGLAGDSAFRCDITTKGFALRADPELLPLVPQTVIERLEDFSNPTGTVDASVIVERAAPTAGGPGAIRVFGELAFRDGTAAFRMFPYPFAQMSGLARFDEEKIELVRVDGIAPTGARLHATGTIAPLSSAAGVDLHIEIEDVPTDEALLVGLADHGGSVVEMLCNRERYDALVAAGLVHAPGGAGGGAAFALGGLASVVVDVQRPIGEGRKYTEQVRIRLPEVGLVPEPFPLPIVARDVEVLVDYPRARIVAGRFEGLSGGRADVEVRVDLTEPEEHGVWVTIRAERVPTDAMLLAALPGGLDGEEGPRSPSAVLRRLGVAGEIDCVVEIGPRDGGELGYDIDAVLDGLSASPMHDAGLTAPAVVLERVQGRLRASEREISLAVRSGLDEAGRPEAPAGELSMDAKMELGEGSQPFTAEIGATLPDVSVALEDLVSVIAPEMAAQLAEVRALRRPAGGVRLAVRAAGDAVGSGEVSRLDVEMGRSDGLAFDTEAGRLSLTSSGGTVSFSAVAPEAVEFDHWSAQVGLDDEPACALVLSGRAPLGRGWEAGDALEVGLVGARMGSPLVRRAAAGGLPSKLNRAIETSAIEGLFDADLVVRGERGAAQPRITGEIRPRRCELTIGGQRVELASIQGGLVLDETGGTLDACRAEGEGWWAEVAGTWVATGDAAVLVECQIGGESERGLVPEVLALLPAELRGALGSVSIGAAGPLSVEGVSLRLSFDEGEGSAYASSGRVVFAGASADVGVKVTEAWGYLDFEGSSVPGAALGNFGVGVIIDSARAGGVRVRDGVLRVTSDPVSGAVLVPVILAEAYGGRVSGSAVVQPGADGGSSYDSEFRLSGVPLGELLADWEYEAELARAAAEGGEAAAREPAESRGLVDAGLTLTGTTGANATRRGRGTVLMGGDAPVMRLPLLLPLIEVSNLQVPGNDPLDFGEAVFFVDGDRVVFERVGVFAQSVEIFGYGQMTLPGLELDLRFSSRAAERLPIVSDLLERFRDELITTHVGGTARSPEVRVEQFARTKRLLAGVTGREPSAEERRMQEIERLSRESERREWRVPRSRGASSRPGG